MAKDEYGYRYAVEKNGHTLALEPYENDRWELKLDQKVVHSFVSDKLDIKALVELLISKGHLGSGDAAGITRLSDWKAFMIAPPPEGK